MGLRAKYLPVRPRPKYPPRLGLGGVVGVSTEVLGLGLRAKYPPVRPRPKYPPGLGLGGVVGSVDAGLRLKG